MKRILGAALVTIITVGGLLQAAITSAQAVETSQTLSSGNGVLYSGCRYHAYTLTMNNPYVVHGWSLDAVAYGPDGIEVSSDFMYADATDVPAHGTLLFCGSDPAGSYTLRGTFEYYDQDYNEHTVQATPITFNMRRPYTKSALTASKTNPRYGETLTLKSTTKDERPNGYYLTKYADVAFQRYKAGAWTTVARRTTDSYGRALFKYTFKSRIDVKFRAVTLRSDYYSRSTSNVVRIY